MKIVQGNSADTIRRVVKDYIDFVGKSYGPAGQSVLIQDEHKLRAGDDGKIISESYELENEFDNAVIKYIKEVTAKTDSRVGDGTTTAALIMGGIVEEVGKLNANLLTAKNPYTYALEIKKGIKEAVDHVKKATKPIKDKKELYEIALNSSNDEELATLISETIFSVGKDGVVSVQDSSTARTFSEVTDGMEIEKGYVSPYFINETNDKVALKNSSILLVNKKLESFKELIPFLKEATTSNKALTIIADGFSEDVIMNFVISKAQNIFKPLLIENPAYGEQKLEFLKDLAAVCDAEVIDPKSGIDFNSLPAIMGTLGMITSITATKTNTIITNSGNKKDIADRITQLKAINATTNYEKDKIARRIAALVGGVAVIKVGANTQNEQETTKLKVEDAVNATRLAFKNGIIRGGGKTLNDINTSSEILNNALKAPRLKLEQNGKEFLDDKVYDPADVLIAAIESGASIGLGLIQMSGIIATKREKKTEPIY